MKLVKNLCSVLLVFGLAPLAWGEDLSSCTMKKTPDEVNFCKASFAGSATFCDMIRNGEKKRECYFMVVKLQRSNTYQIRKPEPKKEEQPE
jgi:hypothetical protein